MLLASPLLAYDPGSKLKLQLRAGDSLLDLDNQIPFIEAQARGYCTLDCGQQRSAAQHSSRLGDGDAHSGESHHFADLRNRRRGVQTVVRGINVLRLAAL